jgi:hypothetical protein
MKPHTIRLSINDTGIAKYKRTANIILSQNAAPIQGQLVIHQLNEGETAVCDINNNVNSNTYSWNANSKCLMASHIFIGMFLNWAYFFI